MPNITIDDYRKMDEKYGNDMEKLFGPTLIAFPEDCDSSRLYMLSSNEKQILTLLNPDVAHVQTGYENDVGKHNHAYKEMPGNWEVKDIIKKFDTSDVYMMVLYNKDENKYDMVEKVIAESLTEKFGFMYNTDKMDSLNIGDTISDEILFKSTSYDDHMNYRLGKNANVMYATDTSTIEDAIKIRKGWADTVQIVEVDPVIVSVNTNDILLNIYGDNNNYKAFPDIGEMVNDCTVCALRRVNLNHALYDFQIDMINKITSTDVEYVTSKNAVIYDLNIFYNGDEEFPDNIFYKQLKKYYDMQCIYADKVTEWGRTIKASGSEYSGNVSYYKAKYQKFNNKEYKWKNKDKVFGNLIIEFKTKAVVTLEEGFKLTGRYGDKGIISNISDCGIKSKDKDIYDDVIDSVVQSLVDDTVEVTKNNVEVLNDCDMPYLEDGTPVDILLNTSGAIRRLNFGQIYEVEINFIAENLRKYIKTLNTNEEKIKIIFRFLELLNKDEYNFFLNMYKEFDRIEIIDGQKIRLLDKTSQNNFIKDIEENGFYIIKRPDSNIRYDVIKNIYKEWDWIKPYNTYIDLFGIKKKKIMRPCIIGSKYMYLLKQTSNKNFSARSTGRVDKKDIPAKSNDKKTNMAIYNRNPLKIGEAHNLFSAIEGSTLAEYNIFMRSSPIGRRSLKKILETDGNPFNIKKLKIKDNYTNVNAEILDAYLKTIGISINFSTDKNPINVYSDYIQDMNIYGYIVVDRYSTKPIYESLLSLYNKTMKNTIFVGNKEDKSNAIWDSIYQMPFIEKEEIESKYGITKEYMKSITNKK